MADAIHLCRRGKALSGPCGVGGLSNLSYADRWRGAFEVQIGEPRASPAESQNRILRSHLTRRLPLTNLQRMTLANIGKRLGRQGLEQIASVTKPEAILA